MYRRRGRWAITQGGVRADARSAELALSEYLEVLWARRLRPLILGAADRRPFARRGLYTHRYASLAVVDLTGREPATAGEDARHDVDAADRAGVQVVPYQPAHAAQVARLAPAVSPLREGDADAWVAVQPDGTVAGIAAWSAVVNGDRRSQAGGALSGGVRRLDLAAVHLQAREAMTTAVIAALIAEAVEFHTRCGVAALELGWLSAGPWWPTPGPVMPAAVVPVLARLRPRWEDRWLAIPAGWQLPAAAWALS